MNTPDNEHHIRERVISASFGDPQDILETLRDAFEDRADALLEREPYATRTAEFYRRVAYALHDWADDFEHDQERQS